MKGLNDDEICDFVQFTEENVRHESLTITVCHPSHMHTHHCSHYHSVSPFSHAHTPLQPVDVRFIEYMPFDGNRWNLSKFVPYHQMLAKVMSKWPQLVRLSDGANDTSKVC